MTSSTSSSERAEVRWVAAWLGALLLVLVCVGIWEVALRKSGIGPEFIDNRALWAQSRQRLDRFGDSAIALLGASRMQRAVDVGVLEAALSRPSVQLAVEGTSALPMLENLAVDPRFRGTVVYAIAPAFVFNRKLSQLDAGNQAGWIRYYREQSRFRRLEQDLRLRVQGLFAFRSPDARIDRVIPELLGRGRLPGPDFRTTHADRSVRIDYDQMPGRVGEAGVAEIYEQTEAYTDADFRDLLNYIATLVRMLKDKGCNVVFLRLPSAGQVREIEDRKFPEQRFWNVMRRSVDATFIHFDDYPELHGYLSRDGSHIDSDKAAGFTAQLGRVLQENGVRHGSARR